MSASRVLEPPWFGIIVRVSYHGLRLNLFDAESKDQSALPTVSLFGGRATHTDVMELRPLVLKHSLSESVTSLSIKSSSIKQFFKSLKSAEGGRSMHTGSSSHHTCIEGIRHHALCRRCNSNATRTEVKQLRSSCPYHFFLPLR